MAAALRILSKGKLFAGQTALRAVISRAAQVPLSRGLSVTSTRPSPIPTDIEQATGLEKKEYDALLAGIEDPFNMKPVAGPPGTKDEPVVVYSMYDERIVGCVCEPDATSMIWRKIYLDKPTRCDCGHWFVLRRGNPIKIALDEPPMDPHH